MPDLALVLSLENPLKPHRTFSLTPALGFSTNPHSPCLARCAHSATYTYLVALFQQTFQLALNWATTGDTVDFSRASPATTQGVFVVVNRNQMKHPLAVTIMSTTLKDGLSFYPEQSDRSGRVNTLCSWTTNLFFQYSNDQTWDTELDKHRNKCVGILIAYS